MNKSRRTFLGGLAGGAVVAALPQPSRSQPVLSRQALAGDPLRPQYHLLPARNWMNDPNGPIYWKGKYHMFFQYNPDDAVWGDMHWNHAVSDDMIHWKHMPIALAPTPGGPDEEGVYSGTAFVQDGRVGMMFTAVQKSSPEAATIRDRVWRETQCIAMADDDDLTSFTKMAAPVIAAPPPHLQVNGFRDPSPWKQDGWWYTPIASGLAGLGGAILLYRSRDLRRWEFVHIFAQRPASFEAYMPWDVWECPEFFALGDRHVLMFSTMGKAFWQTGRFDAEQLTFHAEREGILDYGSYYAPKTQLDADGNRILWGWIQESRPVPEYKAAGWSGMMSLPRVMTLASDGALRYTVAPAAQKLRQEERKEHGSAAARLPIRNCCGEALYRVRRGTRGFTLEVKSARGGQTWLSVGYDPAHPQQILIDYRPLETDASEASEFHLHIDSSVIELIVDNRIAWTKRFYYEGASQDAILTWSGDPASLLAATTWQLQPVSADRLTR